LPSNQWVELTEEGIQQRSVQPGGGGYLLSSAYENIEICIVSRESYKDIKFSVLKFENKRKLIIIIDPVTLVIIPENIDSNSVLKILRDKGVQIIER
jgi:hypothetical protein